MDAATPTPGESPCRLLPEIGRGGSREGPQRHPPPPSANSPRRRETSPRTCCCRANFLTSRRVCTRTGGGTMIRPSDATSRPIPSGSRVGQMSMGMSRGIRHQKLICSAYLKYVADLFPDFRSWGLRLALIQEFIMNTDFLKMKKEEILVLGQTVCSPRAARIPCCERWWRQKEGNRRQPAFPVLFRSGGGNGIRTREELPPTRFPGVRLKPLGHPSVRAATVTSLWRARRERARGT